MKFLVLAVMMLCLPACAAGQAVPSRTLPPQFLGYWRTCSEDWVDINIRDDGWMENVYRKDKSIQSVEAYKVIDIPDKNTAFIMTHDPRDDPDYNPYYKIQIITDGIYAGTGLMVLRFRQFGGVDHKVWQNAAIAEHKRLIAKQINSSSPTVYAYCRSRPSIP